MNRKLFTKDEKHDAEGKLNMALTLVIVAEFVGIMTIALLLPIVFWA